EAADAPVAGGAVGLGEDDVEVRDAGVGDPLLAAVDDPLVAVAYRPGGHRGDVGAGLGLGQAVAGLGPSLADGPHEALLDLLGAIAHDRGHGQVADPRDPRRGGVDAGDLLHADGPGDVGGA